MRLCARLITIALAITFAALPAAAQVLTLPDAEAVFPGYSNMEEQIGFATPCVDDMGTMTINANVADITDFAISIAMVCQVPGYPDINDSGPVSFDDPDIVLLNYFAVPGFPGSFALEFAVPAGTGDIVITIENTDWPEGCIDDLIDFAGYMEGVVSSGDTSFAAVKALF